MKNLAAIFLFLILCFAGCTSESKKASEYQGDGKLTYLKAPPLGISGWRLELPPFGLFNGSDGKYNLAGLPVGDKYKIYLVIPSSAISEVQQGTFSFKLTQGNNTVVHLPPTHISEMTNTSSGPDDNNLWFYDRQSKNPLAVYAYDFNVTKESQPYTLTISYHCETSPGPMAAHVKVERGGYK